MSQVLAQDVPENFFATTATNLEPEVESLDPAERLEFSRPPRSGVHRFDTRDNDTLRRTMFEDPVEMERERAIWEYSDRLRTQAVGELQEVLRSEPDPSIRWTTLWALQKFGGIQSIDVIVNSLKDSDAEVRDWARLLLREITGEAFPSEYTKIKYDETNPFDQTLPLQIAGYARVLVPNVGWVQATLSPKWFELIMGRVMACTREVTFLTDLVIEKKMHRYHDDGTDHYEIYKLTGFSHELTPKVCYHHYHGEAVHAFYPSGKVEEVSIAPLHDVRCSFERGATTVRIGDPERPNAKVVQSTRGRYMGSAYINLKRILANGMRISAGEVQLSSRHHAVAGPLTNTFLFGTFKGKLADLNGDGFLDVNSERCHGTYDGKPDFDLDGVADGDPFDPAWRREPPFFLRHRLQMK